MTLVGLEHIILNSQGQEKQHRGRHGVGEGETGAGV